jgi:glycosyltransferase involved in cell wall biosynthesis
VPSIRSLLASHYRELQVMVINDGSTDGTLAALKEAFELVEVERVPRANLPSAPVRAVYASPLDDRLLVIDKDNGGKADSLNCGIRYAAYPLFCAIDSDTMLDPAALARLVWSFQAEPETVATGGIVRIINGSLLEDGKIRSVRTPEKTLVNVQIVEYLRAFLAGRAGWSRVNMLLIISGAFGLFRRETVVEAGGYDTTTVGEDAELVVRLHRHCRDQKRPYKITFVADPICWTEAPAERGALRRQRDCVIGLLLGWVNPSFAAVLFGLAFTYGLVLSFGALLIEGRAFARYPGWRDLRRLMVAAVVENFGYRQWLAIVRTKALWTVLRPDTGWGEMTRVGFSEPVPAVAPGISSATDG